MKTEFSGAEPAGGQPTGLARVRGPGSPEDGHQFHFEVRVQGSYGIVGDPQHYDAPLMDREPFTLTVRAWSLQEACAKAAQVRLPDWTMPDEELPTEPAPDLHRGLDGASDVASAVHASDADMLNAIALLDSVRNDADATERALIEKLKDRGVTWEQIGAHFGRGANAAQQRYRRIGGDGVWPTRRPKMEDQ